MRLNRLLYPAAAILVSLVAIASYSAEKKDQGKPDSKFVDSGAFGIFVKGARVATETFRIQQGDLSSNVKSEFKTVGSNPVTQKSDLQVTPAGELLSYEWNQSSGGSLTVMPKNEFLVEKITTPSSSKPFEKPFLMPNTSPILDNNFFIHREVLIWRYLAAACKSEGGNFKCQKEPAEFGILVPQDQVSVRIRVELVGDEKVSLRGAARDLLRLNLKGEDLDWALWVDAHDQFKLMKVAIPASNTEAVRD